MYQCYIEFKIINKNKEKKHVLYSNKIIIELFDDQVPITAKNFYSICKNSKESISYKNKRVFRVVKNCFIQTGDITNNDGSGSKSIYGNIFNDEFFYDDNNDLDLKKNYIHDKPFLLSMANHGPNTNNSQFIITMKPLPHMNGKNVVFGKVVRGISTLLVINNTPAYVDGNLLDNIEIIISDCGVLQNKIDKHIFNIKYEKTLCDQILVSISNKLKNISKQLEKDRQYNSACINLEIIEKILLDESRFINNKLISKKKYFSIKISSCILNIICNYKSRKYEKVIKYANITLEIPEMYLTNKSKLQILYFKIISIYEKNKEKINEEELIMAKMILGELYFISNDDITIFMYQLKREEAKIDALLNNLDKI